MQTLPQYDEELLKDAKLPTVSTARFPASCRRFRNSLAARDNAGADAAHRRLRHRVGRRHAGERRSGDAGRIEIRGRQTVLHRRAGPRRPDRARPSFPGRSAELAATKAARPDRQDRRDRARSLQSQGHAVESGGSLIRGGLRPRRRCFRHRRDYRRAGGVWNVYGPLRHVLAVAGAARAAAGR